MKVSNCYSCGLDQSTFYAEENGFSLLKCSGCGLLFVENLPDKDEISQAHKQGKHRGESEIDVNDIYNPNKIARYRNVLEDLFQGNLDGIETWLDVGCGYGEFIETIQKYSSGKVDVKGTEPNVRKQASAKERGLNVDYFDLESHSQKYDVISLLNVYSHLPDPPMFLKSLTMLLNPGGEIILETGDTANLTAKEHYRPFYLPDHLSFASENIVVNILERQNFEILSTKKYPYAQLDMKNIAKGLIKTILPQYESKIWNDLLMWKKYSQTDMFIRARLKS